MTLLNGAPQGGLAAGLPVPQLRRAAVCRRTAAGQHPGSAHHQRGSVLCGESELRIQKQQEEVFWKPAFCLFKV